MKHALLPLAFMLSAGLLTGCFETASLVQVKKDGSGTMTIRMFMSNQLTALAGGLGGDENAGNAVDPVALMLEQIKTDIKKSGEAMGEGVSFQAGKEVKNKAGWKGFEAIFAFEDINTLKATTFSQEKDQAGPGAAGPQANDLAYTFKFTKGDPATLEIVTVNAKEENAGAGDGPEAGAAAFDPAMLNLMKPMLAGMRMSFLITVDGEVVESNGSFRPGNKNAFVLMDVQMDKAFDHPEVIKTMMSDKNGLSKAFDVPGVKVQDPTKPMVIKFK